MPQNCGHENNLDTVEKLAAPASSVSQSEPYRKRWSASIEKLASVKPKPTIFSPREHVKMKIDVGRRKIESNFEKEGHLLCKELSELAPLSLPEDALKMQMHRISAPHIDSLWQNCAKDYADVCTLSCLDSYVNLAAGAADADTFRAGLAALLGTLGTEAIGYYEEQKESFKTKLDSVIESISEPFNERLDGVNDVFSQNKARLADAEHRLKINAALAGIRLSGRDMYTYLCSDSKTLCETCAALDGKHFSVDDAQEGVNLPLMHPNCRCTIEGYPLSSEPADDLDILDAAHLEALQNELYNVMGKPEALLDNAMDFIFSLWEFFFSKSILNYFGTYTTIEIGGKEYRINRNSFSAVAVGPDGKLIELENAKPYDEKMLELMRRRDELPVGCAERRDIEAEIERLWSISDEETRSVNKDNPYSYYILGGDITQQLNEYMHQTEVDYADMHERYWVNNLLEFKALVKNGGKMDLKNQPEWQHSAYIYDGEIVDQDVLGNINYGYFGTFCNIPDVVLLAGAGYAQARAGNSDWAFWFTFFDDPRDSYRVMQGIALYGLWH
jgi:SPP1 gp7 family putative phage head morphogenesis protein